MLQLSRLLLAILFFFPAGPIKALDFETEAGVISVSEIAKFSRPWGMTFLSKTQLVVTEREGDAYLVDLTKGTNSLLGNPPDSYVGGQGGLLDVAAHPDFASNRLLYFSHAYQDANGTGTAVTRARLVSEGDKQRLEQHQVLFMSQTSSGDYHFGSRLVFANDGTLFITIGDHGERKWAQDPAKAAGSVFRIKDDGIIPDDNPVFQGGMPGLWSVGHRNQQGASLHPGTGELWTVEHGARGGDEINKPEAGKNYGWPTISYGRHYSGFKIGIGKSAPGLEQPIHYWDPSIAPSGLAFYDGDLFPQWKGNLFVGALKFKMLVRLTLDGKKVIGEEELLRNAYGRIRDVRQGPQGALWLLTDSPNGKLLRITPAE